MDGWIPPQADPINQSMDQSINRSINQSINHIIDAAASSLSIP
jgi:hypothetical protein